MYLVPLPLIDRSIEKVEHPHALVQLVLQGPAKWYKGRESNGTRGASQMVQGARVKK